MELYRYAAKATRVVDGDTVALEIDLGFHIRHVANARLYGVNTPELNAKDEAERERAKLAKARLEELVMGKPLYVMSRLLDKYGRPLVDIFTDGREESISQVLINEGLGEPIDR